MSLGIIVKPFEISRTRQPKVESSITGNQKGTLVAVPASSSPY